MRRKKNDPKTVSLKEPQVPRRQRPRNEKRLAQEDSITQKAAVYCLRHFPHLWTAASARQEADAAGKARWIVPIILRFPTGFGGEVGLLSYDEGKDAFTVLTDREVMRERARKIAEDPEGKRLWDAL